LRLPDPHDLAVSFAFGPRFSAIHGHLAGPRDLRSLPDFVSFAQPGRPLTPMRRQPLRRPLIHSVTLSGLSP